MGKAFLGAHCDNGLGFLVKINIIKIFITRADGLAQIGNAFGKRIAVIDRLSGGFNQFIDNVRRRGQVRIAHAEIDNINILAPQLHLEFAHNGENVWGKALDS